MNKFIILLSSIYFFLSCATEEVKEDEAKTLKTIEPVIEVTYNPESYSQSDRYCNELTKPRHVNFYVKFEEKGGVCGAECTYEIVATLDNGTEKNILGELALAPHSIRWHIPNTSYIIGCVSSRFSYECKKTGC